MSLQLRGKIRQFLPADLRKGGDELLQFASALNILPGIHAKFRINTLLVRGNNQQIPDAALSLMMIEITMGMTGTPSPQL